MKKLFFLLLLAACSPKTNITGTWKSPQADKQYHTLLVAALTNNTVAKSTLEDEISGALRKQNLTVLKSIDEFPPDVSNSDNDKSEILKRIRTKSVGGILTISLLKKETESRYVRGNNIYDPFAGYDYYRNFWGYYSYWQPYASQPGYYTVNDIYFIETNLYDATTENLVWSAQSQTYNPDNLKSFSKDFAKKIASKLKKDGII